MGILGTPLGYIMYWIFKLINSYGWSLILFVVLTKLLLLPLSAKQQKNTARMAAFQPKLKALEKKCGKDKQKYQQEMMKLYEQEGMSPTAGCLPMLIQFALLFGIIDVIYNPLKHLLKVPAQYITEAGKLIGKSARASQLQIIADVQANTNIKLNAVFPDDILDRILNFDMHFAGIDFGTVPTFGFNLLVLIPILSGVTALITTLITMKQQERNGQTMQAAMKYMMYFTPLMSVWIGFTLPAGVGVYWIVSNIVQIVITLILGRIYTPEKLANMTDKNSEKTKEKMRRKREKLEAYNKMMEAKGKAPKSLDADLSKKAKPELDENSVKDKELAKLRLAEARKKMAEKYGDEYTEE